MTKSDEMQTSPRGRGTNNATPADVGATVKPSTARNNDATNVQSEEEGSTNGEAQPAMDVEATAENKWG